MTRFKLRKKWKLVQAQSCPQNILQTLIIATDPIRSFIPKVRALFFLRAHYYCKPVLRANIIFWYLSPSALFAFLLIITKCS